MKTNVSFVLHIWSSELYVEMIMYPHTRQLVINKNAYLISSDGKFNIFTVAT